MSLTGLGEVTVIKHASFARKTIHVCGSFVRASPASQDAIRIVLAQIILIVSETKTISPGEVIIDAHSWTYDVDPDRVRLPSD